MKLERSGCRTTGKSFRGVVCYIANLPDEKTNFLCANASMIIAIYI